MKVVKALNNNMVLVRDSSGREMICQGKGIGFQKHAGDSVDENLTERRFVPETEDDSRYFEQLFSEIPDEYWELAEQVVAYGRTHFGINVSERIILPLCDHMAGSVERYRRGLRLTNPMLWDIKRIYPKEFKIGRYALDLLLERYGVEMQEDEAAFLAYHFVTAELGDASSQVPPDMMTALTGYVVDLIEQTFQITLDEEDWNYQRFLTHLKFFVGRVAKRQVYEDYEYPELYEELRAKHPHVYQCVNRIADFVLVDFHYDISTEERVYLMIHIERVTRKYRHH